MQAEEGTVVLYYADSEDEYYDVLGLAGEGKFEAIPAPVFCAMLGLPGENHVRVIAAFLEGWFSVLQKTRDEWSELASDEPMRP